MFPSAASSQTEPQAQSSQPVITPVVVQPSTSPATGADQAGAPGQQTGQTRPNSPVQLEEPAAKVTKA
eukprot:11465578-Karenia_brevis.AAC.1